MLRKQIDTIGLYDIIPGLILATIAIVVVSLIAPAPAASIHSMFDDVDERI